MASLAGSLFQAQRMAPATDAYLMPSTPLSNRIGRAVWTIAHALLFRFSPRPLHAWRASLLRLFGARLGADCHVYPGARIWAPWNLECADAVAIADGAIVYNAAPVRLGSHSVVSQQAYLCTATHDIDAPDFPMRSLPITIGARAWIGARASVCPGVTVAEGAVLGMNGVATRDLAAWTVYAGVPARAVKLRRRPDGPADGA